MIGPMIGPWQMSVFAAKLYDGDDEWCCKPTQYVGTRHASTAVFDRFVLSGL